VRREARAVIALRAKRHREVARLGALSVLEDQAGVWHAGCNGYYRSPSGRVVTQWPHTMAEYRKRTASIPADLWHASSGDPA
jgi:hypothetical protein